MSRGDLFDPGEREMVTVNTRYGSADVARYALVVKQKELNL